MPTDLTAEFGDKLADLVTREVGTHAPDGSAVDAKITAIDGTGIAALLVVENTVVTGALVAKTNTTSYQLVGSAAEIKDYTVASGAKPDNWNTCWKVDSSMLSNDGPKPFFRDTYDFAYSDPKKLTAILDAPSALAGKKVSYKDPLYEDAPDKSVDMKAALGSHTGISRAYFSDYLVKKVGNKYHILARFDFYLTFDPVAKDTNKKTQKFTFHLLKSTKTTELLECHKKALEHKTTKGEEPWKDFGNSIQM